MGEPSRCAPRLRRREGDAPSVIDVSRFQLRGGMRELLACIRLNIGSGRGYQPSSVGCSVKTGLPPDRLACAGVGWEMISKRHLFKDTFSFEMHLMP